MTRLTIPALLTIVLAASALAEKVVILGDSLARGAGDESGRGLAGRLGAANLAINGARTMDVLRHLGRPATRAAVRSADVIVLSIGGNDLFGDPFARLRSVLMPRLAASFVAARVTRVVMRIRRENPRARILLLGLYNPYRRTSIGSWADVEIARWDARVIARFAPVRAVTVVRIADLLDEPPAISPIDRYHPSAAGYRAVAARVASAF